MRTIDRAIRAPFAWIAALFALVSASLTLRYMKAHLALSVFDEFQYIDAVDKARRWDVVVPGDMTDQYARILAACRGVGLVPEFTIHQGTCSSFIADSDTFIYGYTSADIHSPLYFFVTAWLSWPIQHLFGTELLTAARLTGIIWLWAGMIALAWALRTMGAQWGTVVALPIAVAAMPVFRITNSYVTPDALNLLAGSLVTGAAVAYAKGERGPGAFIVFGSLFGVVKLQNVFAVVAALVFLYWYAAEGALARRRADDSVARADDVRRGRVGDLAAMTLIPFAASIAWLVARPFIGVYVDRPALDGPADYSLASLVTTVDDSLLVLFAGNGGWGIPTPPSIFASLLLWVVVAGVVATALFDVAADPLERTLARSAAVSALLIGPMTITVFGIVFHAHVTVVTRYVMVLVPLLCLPLARRLTTKTAQGLLGVFAAAAWAYAFALAWAN